MNYFDIVLIFVLVWSFYTGFKKGMVYMLISLLSIIIGLYAAIHFSHLMTKSLHKWLQLEAEQLLIISYIITFVIVFVFIHLIGKVLDKFLEAIALGFVNRFAGGVFSVGIKIIVLSLLFWLFDQGNQIFSIIKEETLNESVLYHPVKDLSPVILFNLEKIKDSETLKKIKEKEFKSDKKIDSLQ